MTPVEDAFRLARIDAVRHMAKCEQARLRWSETTVTEIVISRGAEAVHVVQFTQPAERLSGADWVWWWVDRRGAYGMLVQAKRVTIAATEWRFGFNYPGTGRQLKSLMASASSLGLLPAYALYLGTGNYRRWHPCDTGHRPGRCLQCVKRSVSLMPAILADKDLVTNATSTYERSVALEDVWMAPRGSAPLIPTLKRRLAPELFRFLTEQQDGTRAVTRAMIDRVLKARLGSYRLGVPTHASRPPAVGETNPIFGDLPDDLDHSGTDYFAHVLSPLRHAAPRYVEGIESGDFSAEQVAAGMPESVAGVIVVRLP